MVERHACFGCVLHLPPVKINLPCWETRLSRLRRARVSGRDSLSLVVRRARSGYAARLFPAETGLLRLSDTLVRLHDTLASGQAHLLRLCDTLVPVTRLTRFERALVPVARHACPDYAVHLPLTRPTYLGWVTRSFWSHDTLVSSARLLRLRDALILVMRHICPWSGPFTSTG